MYTEKFKYFFHLLVLNGLNVNQTLIIHILFSMIIFYRIIDNQTYQTCLLIILVTNINQ